MWPQLGVSTGNLATKKQLKINFLTTPRFFALTLTPENRLNTTCAARELAGATVRCGSAQAANKIAGDFGRTLPEVPTTVDFNRCTFPDHRRALKSSPWSGNFCAHGDGLEKWGD